MVDFNIPDVCPECDNEYDGVMLVRDEFHTTLGCVHQTDTIPIVFMHKNPSDKSPEEVLLE